MLLYSKPNNKINKFAKNWLYFETMKFVIGTFQENNKILNQ